MTEFPGLGGGPAKLGAPKRQAPQAKGLPMPAEDKNPPKPNPTPEPPKDWVLPGPNTKVVEKPPEPAPTCQPMNALIGKKIDAVVTGGMGGRAVQKLNEGGIKAYRAIPGTVADIVSQFTKGGLEEITVNNACAQHGCH